MPAAKEKGKLVASFGVSCPRTLFKRMSTYIKRKGISRSKFICTAIRRFLADEKVSKNPHDWDL